MKNRVRRVVTAGAVTAGLLVAASGQAVAQGWRYEAAGYAWLTGMDGTIGVRPEGAGQPVDATFGELAGFLDFAAAGHFEARGEKVVLLGDVNYVGLGAERDAEILGEPATIELDYEQWILELGGGYRVSSEVDLLLVGRYYVQDVGNTVSAIIGTEEGGTTHDWGDVFVGVRWTKPLGERWRVSLRGDAGAGGSSFAWLANAGLAYRFGGSIHVGLDYRVLSLDYESGSGSDYYRYDVVLGGLGMFLGFAF